MTNHRLKLITTEDGSHSLLREDLNETYHSFHGARSESAYVFIEQCLHYYAEQTKKGRIRIFEVGFGTGLNAFLAAAFAEENKVALEFHSVEPFPVVREIFEQLNFGQTPEEQQLLHRLHESPWESTQSITSHFSLVKYETTLEDFSAASDFDMIFFDAFAPSKQAEVWELANLKKCFDLLQPGGILTTYCAQGQFKRNLAAAGFEVQTLKGAMGKKEMVRGVRN